MTIRHACVMLCVSCWLLPLAALSADEVAALGRVFMSPEQRTELDRLRGIRPTPDSPASAAVTAMDSGGSGERPLQSSGFIVRSLGEAYLWVDGDFKKVSHDSVVTGNSDDAIRIIRHPGPDAGPASTPPDPEGTDEDLP